MPESQLKTNTVFKLQPACMNTNTIPLVTRGMILAQGISSRTAATGFCALSDQVLSGRNFDMNNTKEDEGGVSRPNGWPSRTFGFLFKTTWDVEWLHSDIKDVSYYFTFKAFEKILLQGGLR